MPETSSTPATAPDLFAKARSHDRRELIDMARENDLLPYFREVESEPGPVVQMEGRERLMLGSNNYLGLTGDPRVKEAARQALERYGTALTGSRLMNGTLPMHRELEQMIADWMQTEDALVFTTGYQANVGALSSILSASDTVIADSGDHASILDGCKLSGARLRPFRHGRLDKLETMLERSANDGGGTLVVVDGVYSMEGDVCDVASVAALCRRHGARLMVDEAHGVGVLGARGAGASELYGAEREVDLRMGTFSKSLASCGGFIAGPAEVIDFMRISARSFLFTAAAVPAAVAAAREAVRICASPEGPELFARSLSNAAYLARGLREAGLHVLTPAPLEDGTEVITPIVPILVGDDLLAATLWKALWDEGMYTNVALYPAVPPSGALIRTSVMATHERKHLDQAIEIAARVRQRMPELPGPEQPSAAEGPSGTRGA